MNVASYIIAYDGGALSGFEFAKMTQQPTDDERTMMNIVYGAQLCLNFIWSPIFFKYKRMGLVAVDLVAVLASGVWLHVNYKKYNKMAGLLMLPYIGWLCYAGYLNTYNFIANYGSKSHQK